MISRRRDDTNAGRISVLVPSYNHLNYVEEAIRSIWAQGASLMEVIIVDDASTDGSPDRLRDLQARAPMPTQLLVHDTNKGLNATLNAALRLASGDLIAVLASDDRFLPHRFRQQVAAFSTNPSLQVVYGNGRRWDGSVTMGRVHGPEVCRLMAQSAPAVLRYLRTHINPLFIQSALFKRELLTEIGGFDETVLADDWVLNLRIFQRLAGGGAFAYIDDDLFQYRIHSQNSSGQFGIQALRILQVIERYTPSDLKNEGYANVHWVIGLSALASQQPRKVAFRHFFASQRARVRPARIMSLGVRAALYLAKESGRLLTQKRKARSRASGHPPAP